MDKDLFKKKREVLDDDPASLVVWPLSETLKP
jgi:hypothetical protein